jgi:hypothetical protein
MSRTPREPNPTDVRAAALSYLARGWSVIPVRPREKRPLVAWQIYQQQLPTTQEVERWYARWTDANVGIVTGAISGLVVLDVDPRHGGTESLDAWERDQGPLPRTVEARSGGGGRHLYFAHPGGVVHNRVALLPGVDVRGDGGLIVAPPSMHPSEPTVVVAPERENAAADHAPEPRRASTAGLSAPARCWPTAWGKGA